MVSLCYDITMESNLQGTDADVAPRTGPHESAVFLLSKVGHAASKSFADCLEPLGLEPRHFALLNYIASSPGLSQQVLSGALEIPASRLVGVVDDLEERGYVERRRHPADRRARALHLTEDGNSLLKSARRVVRANEANFTRRLD